jgi:hypothetical protein
MSAVDRRTRLTGIVPLAALVIGCTPHAVRVDCDKHLVRINPLVPDKPATTQSAIPAVSSPPLERPSDDSSARQDAAP